MLNEAGGIQLAVRTRTPKEHVPYFVWGLSMALFGPIRDLGDDSVVAGSASGSSWAVPSLLLITYVAPVPAGAGEATHPDLAGAGARCVGRRRHHLSAALARRHHRLRLHPGWRRGRGAASRVGRAPQKDCMTEHPRSRLDDLVHQPVRFSMLAALAQADELEFRFLRDTLELSDSVLSRQASTLEAGRVHRHTQRSRRQVAPHMAEAHSRGPHRLQRPPRHAAGDRRTRRPARQRDRAGQSDRGLERPRKGRSAGRSGSCTDPRHRPSRPPPDRRGVRPAARGRFHPMGLESWRRRRCASQLRRSAAKEN